MTDSTFTIIGIGASAGGLEALQQFLESLPQNINEAIVIAQHLSPTHVSLLTNILKKHSPIEVRDVADGQRIEANIVYVVPIAKNVTVIDGHFEMSGEIKQNATQPSPSVDKLFESIAINWKGEKVGIILSGTGRDGSNGLTSIRLNGGYTATQDVESAKYEGMPLSAQKNGHVDIIANPSELYNKLTHYQREVDRLSVQNSELETDSIEMVNILSQLDKAFDTSFSMYKSGTTHRRIYARMATLQLKNVSDYRELIENNTEEKRLLLNSILIGVTDFFRDFEVFEVFKAHLKNVILSKEERVIRCWVAGCSRGQEAYSLAMMIFEIIGGSIHDWDIKIFATDIDENALDIARAGIYGEKDVEGIPDEYLAQYFDLKSQQYHVKKFLREVIVYSRHDLTIDPPYVRLDVVTCRNVLIYFQDSLQALVQKSFHYGLQPSGTLLLGRSESLGAFNEVYETLDTNAKLYKAKLTNASRFTQSHKLRNLGMPLRAPATRISKVTKDKRNYTDNLSSIMFSNIVKAIAPNNLLIDEQENILYSSSKNPYISFTEGVPSNQLTQLLHDDLLVPMRLLLSKIKEESMVKSQPIKLKLEDGTIKHVQIIGLQAENNLDLYQGEAMVIISFFELTVNNEITGEIRHDKSQVISDLEKELIKSRSESKALLTELDEKNEELQVANEEMQSTNEELQSSNEELASTNEELEATVEELETAYAALRSAYNDVEKNTQALEESEVKLIEMNEDFKRAQKVAHIGHYKWNFETDRMHWSDEMYNIFQFPQAADIKYDDLLNRVYYKDVSLLEKHMNQAKETGLFNLKYRVIDPKSKNGFIYVHGIGEANMNLVTQQKELAGTIRIIDDLVELEDKAKQFEKELANTVSNSLTGIYIYSFELQKNKFVNQRYYDITGYNLDSLGPLNNDEFMELFHPDDQQALNKHMTDVLQSKEGQVFTLKYRFKHKKGHWVTLLSQDSVSLRNISGEPLEFTGSFIDISSQAVLERASETYSFLDSSFPTNYGIALVNQAGELIRINKQLSTLLGYSKDELLNMTFIDVTHPDDLDADMVQFNQLIHAEIRNYSMTKRYITKQGSCFRANLNVTGIYNENNQFRFLIGLVEKLEDVDMD